MKTLTTLVLACCFLATTWAQNNDTTTAAGAPTGTGSATAANPTPKAAAAPLKQVRVDRIGKFNPDYWGDKRQSPVKGDELNADDYVIVDIHEDDMNFALARKDSLRLWMGGICFPDMKVMYVNRVQSFVVFQLERDTTQTSPWQLFYTWPTYWKFHRNVSVNLGTLKDEYKVTGKTHIIQLHTSLKLTPYIAYIGFLALLFLLARYGKGLIRDVSLYARNGVVISYNGAKTDAAKGVINIHDIPYSLARMQFLLWLIVVFFGILHIWAITDVLTSPSGSVLALLGISGGTFYIGKLLDTPKPTQPDTRTPQQIVNDLIANNKLSQNPILDIINDGNNSSLHRLQLFIFTIFLAIYFIIQVMTHLVMPSFTETMMGLMGISSLTYAGIKTTEPAPGTNPPADPPANP